MKIRSVTLRWFKTFPRRMTVTSSVLGKTEEVTSGDPLFIKTEYSTAFNSYAVTYSTHPKPTHNRPDLPEQPEKPFAAVQGLYRIAV